MDGLVPPSSPLALGISNTTSSLAAPIVEELLDEVDLEQCRLLGPFALVIQGILASLILLSLVLKRMREKPRRRWKIWLGDVGKQVVGQGFVHASNVLISDLIATHRSDNPCSLYALNILLDTTLGVLILYYFLHLSTTLMRTHYSPTYHPGFYGPPPTFSLSLWGTQAAVYIACLAAMKLVVLLLFWVAPGMEDAMTWLLSWTSSDEAQVFTVMLVLPLVMNLFQFLTVDSILKSNDTPPPLLGESDEEALRRGFLEHDDGEDTLSDNDEDEEHGAGGGRRGSQRGLLSRGGDVGDEGEEDEDENSKERERPRAAAAEQSLLDAEEGHSDALPVQHTQPQRSLHSYPPSAPPLASARPASILSQTPSLPPYSSLPPAAGSFPHPQQAQHQQQQQQGQQHREEAAGAEEDDEDDWARGWSGSEDGDGEGEDESRAVAPTSVPHAQVASAPSSALPPAPLTPSLPHPLARTPSPQSQSAALTSPLPRAPSPLTASTALPQQPSSFAAATPPVAAEEAEEAEEGEGAEDDWGFGEEEEEEEPRAPSPPAAPTPPPREPSPPPATDPRPHPPAAAISSSLPPTAAPRHAEPATVAEEEAADEGEDEDWGFGDAGDDADADAQDVLPAAEAEEARDPNPLPPSPPPPRAASPPPSSPPARIAFPPPPPPVSIPASTPVASDPPPPQQPEEEEEGEQEQEDEDEDDWGFSVSSPAAPSSVALSPEAEKRPLPSTAVAVPPASPPAAAEDEEAEELSEKPPLPEEEEEEDDDWGFDSPSLEQSPAELKSAVDRVLGLRDGAALNEKVEDGGEKIPAPGKVGRELEGDGLF
ncbi:hypothetical protein JCM10213_004277 [Rhodosporidiobolus nylandii]